MLPFGGIHFRVFRETLSGFSPPLVVCSHDRSCAPCQLGRPGTEVEDYIEDRVPVQEVKVQDMVEPVLAASSWGRRGS